MENGIVQHPTAAEVPIILSVPHCGTEFPEELKNEYKEELRNAPDDTDWFVDKLYSFGMDMGITMIHSRYSRWVIDLNRDPESKPLYSDGRIITALCPTTTFFGEAIYKDERKEVAPEEVKRRIKKYYTPYHQQLASLIEKKRKKFGKVLVWECHSIRQHVPTIYKEKFPDLILGDVDGTSASKQISEIALSSLRDSAYDVAHNHPFKGGYITRQFGKPNENIHVLQLEMSKVMYMNDEEKKYEEKRAEAMQSVLKKTIELLITELQ